MQVIEIKEMDDCFDGNFMKEVIFDEAVTKALIDHLAQAGELQYFPSFAHPFFRIDADRLFIIKGIEGQNRCRLILGRDDLDRSLTEFLDLVRCYDLRPKTTIPA